ncbi:MAG: PilZ domain-containing protein [Spirochaetota bacterium]
MMPMHIFDYLGFVFLERNKIKDSVSAVRIPVTLNILGHKYFLETRILTEKIVYLTVYREDIEILPENDSSIVLFLSLNFYSRGKVECIAKLKYKEILPGDRLGLWIEFIDIQEEDTNLIKDFLASYYSPRYSVRFEVILQNDRQEFPGEAINLSENGIFVETDISELKAGDGKIYQLWLYPYDQEIYSQGQITWLNTGKLYDKPYGCGIKFLHTQDSQKKIHNYIHMLKTKSEIVR